ncbi:Nicotinate-nucleotide--dimethylbenzimidazole phosphoribosyltransferase [Thioalkalivibrio nitratireducens DSM 14787]|uniref:Nicotinate-nucleotide--dimethylbenzimidazole phosphoribosyltransferase n=1 Tax=Thioalkalivibrio nitratireducens (strain DSM 14787 / UNIQEM 213 / ALEN2) TaxID=1255043 RepID=L0E1K2_THIND|nr:nicotinate-nucleotide--dimethylbenzimidazole phosphoribosyltransferase [Thioalkalivibrio nitratireducens]AGA35122.1 Nicotinate-nucleotide--dimethylbenzimidazole phosphoribosyltransferase [Thioalkalivibrio nitratireducens DSM 14787]
MKPAGKDLEALEAARQRQCRLTKPRGALGELEQIAIRLAGIQGRECPEIHRPWITVFAGDHGVVAEGVSAFPQAVTGQMIVNFAQGGAAISVLAEQTGSRLEVVDVGSLLPDGEYLGVRRERAGPGTANFTREPAMTATQLGQALASGGRAVHRAREAGADLFVAGEMGIGNTTAATALACALLDHPPEVLTGPGTGLDAPGVAHKAEVIRRALFRHRDALTDPREILRHLGGFEIAAMTGAYLACAERRMPAVIDGLISSVAALIAERISPGASQCWLLGHRSAEPAHRDVLDALGGRPLLDLGMRLGEGSGAAAAIPLIQMACALHRDMATFDEAGVASGR